MGRATLNEDRLESAKAALEAGIPLPPIKVNTLETSEVTILDGFHRAHAAKALGLTTVQVALEDNEQTEKLVKKREEPERSVVFQTSLNGERPRLALRKKSEPKRKI